MKSLSEIILRRAFFMVFLSFRPEGEITLEDRQRLVTVFLWHADDTDSL
ncbi:hypothetical protein C8C83_0427 [Flavobacterium sp. 90]|nr:hypothetical protein C8C82_0722 [Flavobacterium sp. 81]TCK52622.1 hypothetical protein C8C83_0427 [Flavobacterium sp. 90]